nr:hypothetical protein [Tanacetum cinerariifolium]
MAKARSSQASLWHRHLSHLDFDTINLLSKNDIVIGLPKLKFVKDQLCSSCELGKAKRKSFQTKTTPSSKRQLQLLHMDLCGPMRVESINGKKYVLIIVDDYSRYTWTYFLRSKDETPEVLIDFPRLVKRGLHAQVRIVQTDKGTEFLNKTLHAYFASEGIQHQTSVARTPEQNEVVKRQNHTLVEAARTMLSAAKVSLDGENLDKMKEKGDACIFVGYSTQSRAYMVFIKRTRVIVETIHVNFDELPYMASDHVNHLLEQVIGNPSQSVRTRCQLELDGEMCMFALTVSQTKPKNIKESMQEELHQEEVYVNQPGGFVYPYHPDKVYRLKKALYGLKQALRVWYNELSNFLVSKGFSKAVKRIIRYLKDTIHMGLWYPKDTGFDLTAFLDLDHASCLDSRKSTSGGIQFLGGDKLVSWSYKKKDCTSMSSVEAEYVSLSACCAQVLWLR